MLGMVFTKDVLSMQIHYRLLLKEHLPSTQESQSLGVKTLTVWNIMVQGHQSFVNV